MAADVFGSFMGISSPPMPPTPSGGGYGDAGGRFNDPAIISFAGLNGYAGHNPYATYPHHGHHHGPPPGFGDANQQGPPLSMGSGQQDYYNRYQPLPTPVQPQQTYNSYVPVGPVGLGGMGRLQAAQAMSQAGAFGLLRR